MKHLLLSALPLLLFTACGKDEQDPVSPPANTSVTTPEGLWSLMRFEGGFVPIVEFSNEVYWSVTDGQILVMIADGTTIPVGLPLGANGAYSYEQPSASSMSLNGLVYTMAVTDTSLVLEYNLAADGMRLTFVPGIP